MFKWLAVEVKLIEDVKRPFKKPKGTCCCRYCDYFFVLQVSLFVTLLSLNHRDRWDPGVGYRLSRGTREVAGKH